MDLFDHVKISFILINYYGLENFSIFEKVTFINYLVGYRIINISLMKRIYLLSKMLIIISEK